MTDAARLAGRAAALPVVTFPDLPVSEHRQEIAEAIRDHQVVVVAGETGSGKTTQLPKICLQLGRGIAGTIGHTQPRRLAARSVAERIASELGQKVGEAVGYQVRFSEEVGPNTLVKLMTDGILLNEIQTDPLLSRYDTIIVDEAHERSLNIDFILGYLARLLPQRPDLKLIITSATIDSDRFAQHYSDLLGQPVPVIEVSGRTYPVEVRYRPLAAAPDSDAADDTIDTALETLGYGLGESIDLEQGVLEAVDELLTQREGGDILVFLPGERDIREMQRALEDRPVEVVPLYARLSAAEQQRIFQPHDRQRVILSTNIAETSLTVPGVRYVVDSGLARISRFSNKTKVQRLPIEGVSQASANQRSGRAGRLSDGIAIRLYSEDDFAGRAEYTEPEILRTSLASVILQMSALGLGEVADFPFIDAPSSRAVRDGVQLLVEIGALTDAGDLTPIGRKLARLPIDPRLGRMLLAGDANGCGSEVLVIVAALSIQDVRERPLEAQAAADEAHARFENHDSDFLTYLNLWRYLNVQSRDLSGSAFRRLCRREYLHYLRYREWHDVVSQLQRMCRQLGMKISKLGEPSRAEITNMGGDVAAAVVRFGTGSRAVDYDQVHRSLLVGLLSNVGSWDELKKNYVGARGTRFTIWPGSGVRSARWVMAAELVETSRLFARTVARIKPEWIEECGEHLLVRTYSEPYWSRAKGAALIKERVLLYGLTMAADRSILLGRLGDQVIGAAAPTARPAVARPGTIAAIAQGILSDDRGRWLTQFGGAPSAVTAAQMAHEMFLREALVLGKWRAGHLQFVRDNERLLAQAQEVADRHRDDSLIVDEDDRFQFFAERVPERINNARSFEKWWKRQREETPDLLTFDTLLHESPDPDDFPEQWQQGKFHFPLSFNFGARGGRPNQSGLAEGVTVTIPLALLPQVKDEGFDWLVPGLLDDLCAGTIRALPKDKRRQLIPAPEVGAQIAARLRAAKAGEAEPTVKQPEVVDQLQASLGRLQEWAGVTRSAAPTPAKTPPAPSPTPAPESPTDFYPAFVAAARALRGVELDPQQEPELPENLRMHFRVTDDRGKVVGTGTSLTHLQQQLAKRADKAVSRAVSRAVAGALAGARDKQATPKEATPKSAPTPKLTATTEFPAGVDWSERRDGNVRAFPAFTTGGSVEFFATPERADAEHLEAVARLLLEKMRLPTARVTTRWSCREALLLSASPYPDTAALVEAAQLQAARNLARPVRTPEQFAELLQRHVFEEEVYQVLMGATRTLSAAADLETALEEYSAASLEPVRRDARRRLKGWISPGFLAAPERQRYLRAQTARLQRASRDAKSLQADQNNQRELAALAQQISEAPETKQAELWDAWERLTVALFGGQAQPRSGPKVSVTRLQRQIAQANHE